jgi:pimeloyl-ACP methyl ester carboxylesterase
MTADVNTHEIRQGTIEANGIRFAFLEAGDGPLVLLLHGFPDNAWTWSRQLPALADAGYHAVAPFLRGYPPTEIPADGRYDVPALAEDLAALIRALDGEPAHVVGHDWGATMTYGGTALFPSTVRRATVIALGHPSTLASVFESPALLHHLFHVWLFQLDGFAQAAASANDHALIDYLWRHWSPHHDEHEHVACVKRETLSLPGALEAALSYYPALLRLGAEQPEAVERLTAPISVPTLAIFGGEDPVRELSAGEEALFTAPYRFEVVQGAGHFVHRERPDEVTRLVLDWLAAGDREPAAAAPLDPR